MNSPMGTLSVRIRRALCVVTLCAARLGADAQPATDAGDWPMYNRDVAGTRHNRAERSINPSNAGTLVEKWRFPATASDPPIGVIHATPVVVGGYVYFGTATDPAFYKLTPDGKVRWVYRRPGLAPVAAAAQPAPDEAERLGLLARFQASGENGILCSALVTDDTVYFGDAGGWFYALDRTAGTERWTLNARDASFPGAHALNVFIASPILADGKLIVAGGAIEQPVAAIPG